MCSPFNTLMAMTMHTPNVEAGPTLGYNDTIT